ncbi:unnamed protein product [Linum trigynum]|uniref:Uncharacterized protein n=1 Tax=Linum trigynum TaxID=586398 RepID=A0AAV2EPD5_9ROSI
MGIRNYEGAVDRRLTSRVSQLLLIIDSTRGAPSSKLLGRAPRKRRRCRNEVTRPKERSCSIERRGGEYVSPKVYHMFDRREKVQSCSHFN